MVAREIIQFDSGSHLKQWEYEAMNIKRHPELKTVPVPTTEELIEKLLASMGVK